MKGLSYLQYKLAEQEAATISQNAANLNLMISIINALSNLFTEMEHEAKSDNWPLTKNLSSMVKLFYKIKVRNTLFRLMN